MLEKMTAAAYRAMTGKERRTGRVKGARRTFMIDRWFDSVLEARRYGELVMLMRAGRIERLRCQVHIHLIGEHGPIQTPTGRQMRYVADFTYRDSATGENVIEDAKGWMTETYLMKKAVLKAMGYEIREITRGKRHK